MTQDIAYKVLTTTNRNILLTGKPGAGKSFLTNKYIEYLLDNGISGIEVTASTGIAALNIGGKTLHSFLGIRGDVVDDSDIEDIVANRWTVNRIKKTKILIIDEVSMVSDRLLDLADIICREVRGNDKPFGGIRVILVGDFFQLPPVSKKGEPKAGFAFKAKVWEKADFGVCYLTEQHRSNDDTFNDILSGIRTGVITDDHKKLLKTHIFDLLPEDIGPHVRLDTHNKRVDDFNNMRLSRLTTPASIYNMTGQGTEAQIAMLKNMCQSPEKLVLREGARVIFTQNDNVDQQYVNGTVGEVTEVHTNRVVVKVNNNYIEVTPRSWELATGYGKNKTVHASITQLPLRLAWAITIHKSQGMTLDKAVIDLSRVFESGQGYVAISRLRSLSGLYFQGKLTERILMVDKEVIEKDKEFHFNSEQLCQLF